MYADFLVWPSYAMYLNVCKIKYFANTTYNQAQPFYVL